MKRAVLMNPNKDEMYLLLCHSYLISEDSCTEILLIPLTNQIYLSTIELIQDFNNPLTNPAFDMVPAFGTLQLKFSLHMHPFFSFSLNTYSSTKHY